MSKSTAGSLFFTLTLADQSSDLLVRQVDRLRRIYMSVQKRYPFETVAICVLPDHLHAVWSLPPRDRDYPLRWSVFKSGFSRGLTEAAPRTASKIAKRERGDYGNVAIGNIPSAMMPILSAMSITFILIP